MFAFLTKKPVPSGGIYAPVTGRCIDLSDVPDEVFASRLMGEGVAFSFDGDTIYSPVQGKVTMIPAARHAIGLARTDGVELLIHVGTDTDQLGGQGFTVLVREGARVRVGTPLLRIDRAFMARRGIGLITSMVVTGAGDRTPVPLNVGGPVEAGKTPVLELRP